MVLRIIIARGLRPISSVSKSFLRNSSHCHSARFQSIAAVSTWPVLQRAAVATLGTSFACAFCSASTSAAQGTEGRPKVTLYQYEPCPYCCKVKAVLDYFKIPYQVVEVNPLTKKEMKAFTEYRKVPVVRMNDEVVVDSSRIISRLRELGMTPERRKELTEEALQEEETWRQWVDQQLIVLTPPNIYRTLPEALEAFNYCLTEGNFTAFERRMAKYTGALVMYWIAKQSKKKYGIEDERQALYSALNSWVEAIGEERVFLGGEEPNLADLSVFGVLRAMHGLETYNDIMRETKIEPWFTNMTAKVGASARVATTPEAS